jgi:hypothetical protein
MCPGHWRLVPRGLQRAVNESFNPAQCQGKERVHPAGAWMVAADAAILAVWLLEGPAPPPEKVKRICEHTMHRAAMYAYDMDEDWRAVLENILPRIPEQLQVLSDAVKRMLRPHPPRRRRVPTKEATIWIFPKWCLLHRVELRWRVDEEGALPGQSFPGFNYGWECPEAGCTQWPRRTRVLVMSTGKRASH